MNKVFLSGTVESEPELRLETGKPDQATFRLSAWHRAEDGQWRREAYTVCCQDKRAYWAMVNIEAGQRIAVEGTLLGAGQVKIAAQEITYTFGRKRENGYTEDTKYGTTQGTTDDDADEGCEKEEPMETAEQTKELGGAQTEAQTPTQGKAQSNDGIDPRQRKWYDVGKRNGRTAASRARSAQGRNAAPGDKDGNKDGRFSRMRKKLLSMMLALVMALGVAVIGGAEDARPEGERTEGAQEELHMLWDIPWGSTPEEVRRLAKENANVSLVPIRSDDVDLWQGLQKVSMFGYPVSVIQFLFDHNEKLYDVEIGFKKFSDDSKQMIAEAAGMAVEDICIQISEKYGDLTLGEFAAQKEKGDKQIQYQFPMAEEKIDYRLIMQAALEQRHIRLYIYWDNFLFRLFVEEKDNQYEISMYLSGTNETFYALMKEGSEVLPIYPKDPLFQTMKEIVDGTGPDINVGI